MIISDKDYRVAIKAIANNRYRWDSSLILDALIKLGWLPISAIAEKVEYAELYAGGSMLVWPDDTGSIFPLEQHIEAGQRFGGKVLKRRVLVIKDWTEVPHGRPGDVPEETL